MRLAFATCILLTVCTGTAEASTIESFTEPYRRIDIAPAEPGIIATIDVREGDSVKPGQQLASLDCDALRISLEIAKTSRDARGRRQAAVAERDLRQVRLAKLEELRPRGHASGEEVERARADLEVAQSNLLAIEEQRRVDELECAKAEALIERRIMRSPIDGVVTRVFRDQREFVTGSNPTVMTVVQLNPLRATFSVPTALAAKLQAGQEVRLLFPDAEKQVQAKVELISPVTEAESGTVRVKVLLDNSQNRFRCGVRCELDLDSGKSLSPFVTP
jgi:RND family efflux transporter MFP subunit